MINQDRVLHPKSKLEVVRDPFCTCVYDCCRSYIVCVVSQHQFFRIWGIFLNYIEQKNIKFGIITILMERSVI